MAQVDPRDMLNKCYFHVYAQKSLFIGENGNAFFDQLKSIFNLLWLWINYRKVYLKNLYIVSTRKSPIESPVSV